MNEINSKITLNRNYFIKYYSDLYRRDLLDLEAIIQIFDRKLNNINVKLSGLNSALQPDFKDILLIKNILTINIEAKKIYYTQTSYGKIAAFFQAFFKKMGSDTSIEKAENVLAKCSSLAEKYLSTNRNLTENEIKTITNECEIRSIFALSKIYVIKTQKGFRWRLDKTGNILEINKNGAISFFDEGYYLLQIGKEHDPQAILNSLPPEARVWLAPNEDLKKPRPKKNILFSS